MPADTRDRGGRATSLLRAVSATAPANVAARALALFSTPFLARGLGVDTYGLLETALLAAMIGGLVCRLGLDQAVCRFVALSRKPSEARSFSSTGFVALLGSASAVTLLVLALSPLIDSAFFSGRLSVLAAAMLAGKIFTESIVLLLGDLMRFVDKLRWYVIAIVLTSALNVCQIAALAAFDRLELGTALAAYVVSDAIVLSLLLLPARPWVSGSFEVARLRPLLGFGLPLLVSTAGFFVMQAADRFFLAALNLYTDLGLYALAYKLALLPGVLLHGFGAAFTPFAYRLFRDDPREARDRLPRIARWYVATTSVIAIAVVAVGEPAAVVLGGPAFRDAADVLPLVLGAFLANAFGNFFCVGIDVTGKTGYRAATAAGAAVLNLTLNFLLIPPYGMIGAAIATFVSYWVASLSLLLFSNRVFPIPFPIARAHVAYLMMASFALLPLIESTAIQFLLLLAAMPSIWTLMGLRAADVREGAMLLRVVSSRAQRT